MSTEIERKFLVRDDAWRDQAVGVAYRQGFLSTDKKNRTVRVRIAGDLAYLTVKGISRGVSRTEFEYEIPISAGTLIPNGNDAVPATLLPWLIRPT